MKRFLFSSAAGILVVLAAAPVFAVPWVSRHGMTAAEYQTEFNTWTAAPYHYRLISVSGYEQGGQAHYAAIWEERSGPAWITHPGMTPSQFDSLRATYAGQDFHPVLISGFAVGGQAYYNAIWEYLPGAEIVPAVGLTSSALAAENRTRSSQGYTLVHLWTYNVGSLEYFAAIWRKGVTPDYQVRTQLSGAEYQQAFNDLGGQGFQLVCVRAAVIAGVARYAGVWKKPGDGVSWYSQHSLPAVNYQGESWNWEYQGYRPVFVSAFVKNGAPRFNAIWFNNGGMTPGNLKTINDAIATYMSDNNVPGLSLAISRQGQLVYAKGFGSADQAADESVHPNHRFRIASVSKPITAAAVLKLRDHCGLNLDDTVFGPNGLLGNSFGTPPYSAREQAITVRHLLYHTSGWTTDGIWQVSGSDPDDAIDWQLNNASGEPTSFPGTSYTYMNIGFCTAGRVIERASGKSYEQFVKDELLRPSCVTDMEIGGATLLERKPGEAVYYGGNPYGLNPSRMDAHGGWIARPIDLLLLLRRIDGNSANAELLENASLTAMLTPSMAPGPNGGGTNYGLGMVVNSTWWGHNGAMDGTIAFMVYRNDGIGFAFTCNTRPPNDQFAGGLRSVVNGIINTLNAANAWPAYDLFPCNVPPGGEPTGLSDPEIFTST
jgi:CubicO group peptidase (beta-lactamase class C family)